MAHKDTPNSWDEKVAEWGELPTDTDGHLRNFPHWMFVHELRDLLNQLEPDDWLTPNTVNNLCIGRGDNYNIGIVNFHRTGIEFWDERE